MNNRITQYELEEAKKRMRTYTAEGNSGMTNTMAGTGSMAHTAQLDSLEKLQAQKDINNFNKMY